VFIRMKAFIVLNPASGKNARKPIREAVSRYFTSSQIEYEIYETVKEDNPGDPVLHEPADENDIEASIALSHRILSIMTPPSVYFT